MLADQIRTKIIGLIRKAHYAIQQANNFGNEVARQREVFNRLWRDITKIIYPNNPRLQRELYNQGIQNLENNIEHFTRLLTQGTVGSIIQISRSFQEQITSWQQQIQNAGAYIQQNLQDRYNEEMRVYLNTWYRQYQQTATNGQSFREYLQNQRAGYSDSAISSFLNWQSRRQDDMTRPIVPWREHQNAEISSTSGAIQNLYNQQMERFQQQQTMSNTQTPTTTSQTPTTQAPTPTERAGGQGPTSGGQHGETGVELIQYTKFHPFKRTEQVLMPFYNHQNFLYTENATSATAHTYRLNSIYDIIHGSAAFSIIDPNIAAPTADTPDASPNIQVPMMREYWKQFYSYWHVVKCEWKFSILPPAYDRGTNIQFQLFFYEHGIQYPPVTQTVNSVAKLIPWHVRKYHPHVRQHTIENVRMDDQRHNRWQTITGVWQPGDIQHEVAEDEFTRVWHKFEQVPPTSEKLTIMLQLMDGFDTSILATTSHVFQTRMTIHYTVQLKDLKTQYEFITEATGIPAVTDFRQKTI